ncbi:carbohydrate kinase [Meiothermus sp.]|uniref:carbohydrate kinase family protein n=1 Tax=Meiothermus sp. TaxID=1955249 RepID=UPI00307D7B7A
MIIVAGEALIDLKPVRGEHGFLLSPHPGGSPYNVALGVGRLGVPVAFLGRFSTDAFGELLQAHLRKSRVDLGYAVQGPELTTLAVVTPGAQGESFSFYAHHTADTLLKPADLPPLLPEGALLHFGSISLVLEPTASTLEALMQREAGRRLISLDPNVRPFLIPDKEAYKKRLRGWLALSDLVKVSQVDLDWLYPGHSVEQIAREWLLQGPQMVVVTLGSAGAVAFTPAHRVQVEAPQVTVVDTVGAGDAFMAALLVGLYRSGSTSREQLALLDLERLSSLLSFATKVAALTCTRAGADPPWQEEVM